MILLWKEYQWFQNSFQQILKKNQFKWENPQKCWQNPRDIIRGTPQYNCHHRCRHSGHTNNTSACTSHIHDQYCQQFKQKSKEADKGINEIKELKNTWRNLEVEIKSLVQEINQVKVRMQEASMVPHIYPSAPVEEPIGGFQRGQVVAASKQKFMPSLPSRSTEVYSFNMQ